MFTDPDTSATGSHASKRAAPSAMAGPEHRGAAVLARASGCGPKRIARNGDILPAGGSSAVVFIHEGWAVRYRLLPDGRRMISNFLLPGDSTGLEALAIEWTDHSIMAATDSVVTVLRPAVLRALCQERPELVRYLAMSRAQEAAILLQQLTRLGRMNACERTAHMLLELWYRAAGVGQANGNTFHLPLTLGLLGDALALSSEHVSRMFGTLRDAGLLVRDEHEVTLLDPARLAEACDFDPAYLRLEADPKAWDASATLVDQFLRAAA